MIFQHSEPFYMEMSTTKRLPAGKGRFIRSSEEREGIAYYSDLLDVLGSS